MLQRQSLWVAFLAGLWAGPGPHVELVGALGVGGCRENAGGHNGSVCAVSFAFAEIPLINYLLTPAKTSALLNRAPEWLRAHRVGAVAVALAVLGVYLVATSLCG
jgi:uncharacterized protein involved in cysteine biosynthesis